MQFSEVVWLCHGSPHCPWPPREAAQVLALRAPGSQTRTPGGGAPACFHGRAVEEEPPTAGDRPWAIFLFYAKERRLPLPVLLSVWAKVIITIMLLECPARNFQIKNEEF